MGWEYINSDLALCKPNRFRLRLRKFSYKNEEIHGCAGSGDRKGSGPDSDRPEAHSKTVDIEFQFPPKVLNDGRKGNWYEGDLAGGEEPVAVFRTSGPREITIAWTYVVDSFDQSNSTAWTIDRITRNIRTLRGYFALARGWGAFRDDLAVGFHMWCIGGDQPITGRIKSVDVKYGETMVFPPGSPGRGFSDRAFPLRTDITVDFRIWTKGLRRSGAGDEKHSATGKFGAQDIRRLTDYEPTSWY